MDQDRIAAQLASPAMQPRAQPAEEGSAAEVAFTAAAAEPGDVRPQAAEPLQPAGQLSGGHMRVPHLHKPSHSSIGG